MRVLRIFPVLASFALVATACSIPHLANYERTAQPLPQTSFLYAAGGSLITRLHASQDRILLRYNQMPESIKQAVVAIEDGASGPTTASTFVACSEPPTRMRRMARWSKGARPSRSSS